MHPALPAAIVRSKQKSNRPFYKNGSMKAIFYRRKRSRNGREERRETEIEGGREEQGREQEKGRKREREIRRNRASE